MLKGTCREELKKVKHVVQYAVFAAYHLSLETSFLADEGASLPKMALQPSIAVPERAMADSVISVVPNSLALTNSQAVAEPVQEDTEIVSLSLDLEGLGSLSVHPSSISSMNSRVGNEPSDVCYDDLASGNVLESCTSHQPTELKRPTPLPSVMRNFQPDEEMNELTKSERADEKEVSSEYFSASETHQSILVSFSSHCVLKGTVCERSRLQRIKFYGCFDKPLGRYLRDNLFNQVTLLGGSSVLSLNCFYDIMTIFL